MRLSQSSTSHKYAIAYLNVFDDVLTYEDIENMAQAVSFFEKSADFMLLVCAENIDDSEKNRIFDKMMQRFSLHVSLKKLLSLLMKRSLICSFAQVLKDICCLYKQRHNMIDLHITTAQELTAEQKESFEKFFTQLSKKHIISKTHVDESLVAGVRLQSDILLWEYSVASRLKTLRQKLFAEG